MIKEYFLKDDLRLITQERNFYRTWCYIFLVELIVMIVILNILTFKGA